MTKSTGAVTPEESKVMLKVELPTTSDLFKKHFNDYGGCGIFHKNIEAFFSELNTVCQIEDALKDIKTLNNNL